MTIRNLGAFTGDLEAFDREFRERHHAGLRKLALDALRGIIFKSPVDTGRFRGNWNTSLGGADLTVTESTDKGGNTTFMRGSQIVARVDPFGTIFIANNLPYAEKLEEGSSKQAPAGMVAITIAEIEAAFR